MTPRLVEPGFAVACLHADVPARPGKDQDDENEAVSVPVAVTVSNAYDPPISLTAPGDGDGVAGTIELEASTSSRRYLRPPRSPPRSSPARSALRSPSAASRGHRSRVPSRGI